jgi:hypothetical protein
MDNNGNKLTWTVIIIAALTIIGYFIINNFTTLATGDSYSMQAYLKDTEASIGGNPVVNITNNQISNDGKFNAKIISNYYGWYSLATYGTVYNNWWDASKKSLHLAVAKLDTSDITDGSTVKLKSNAVGAGLISKDSDTKTYTYSITVPLNVGKNVKNENNSDNYYLLLWWGSADSTTNEIKSVDVAKLVAVPTNQNWGGLTGHIVTLNTNGFSLNN